MDIDPSELEFNRVKMGIEDKVIGLGKKPKENKEKLLAKVCLLKSLFTPAGAFI
jgi:hypothetical protein